MENHNDIFSFNKEEYELLAKKNLCSFPNLEKEGIPKFKPKEIIQYRIELPFSTRLPDRMSYTKYIPNKGAIQWLYHTRVKSELKLNEEALTGYSFYKSFFDIIYIKNGNLELSDENVSIYFDDLIKHLNVVLLSYQAFTKDDDCHRIKKEMLQELVFYRHIVIEDWIEKAFGIFNLHANVPYEKQELTTTENSEVLRHIELYDYNLNPFIFSEEFKHNSSRLLKNGFYRDSVIYSQMCVESFLINIFCGLLSIENKFEESILDDLPFIRLVKKEIHERLGGCWDIKKEGCIVNEWHKSTYEIRNAIVHGGYFPKYQEAVDAHISAYNLIEYVISLVKKAKPPYNQLNRYFIEYPQQ